jgi:hypothetical protein
MSDSVKTVQEMAMTQAVDYAHSNIPDCLFNDDEIRDLIRNAFMSLNLNENERSTISNHSNSLIKIAASRYKTESASRTENQ